MNVMHMKVKHILLYFIKISFSLIVKLLKYTWISPNQFSSCIHSSNLHLLVIIVCIVTVCTNFCDYLVACADGERGRFIVNALYKCLRIAIIPYVIWSRKKWKKIRITQLQNDWMICPVPPLYKVFLFREICSAVSFLWGGWGLSWLDRIVYLIIFFWWGGVRVVGICFRD